MQFRSASDEFKSKEHYENIKDVLQAALRTGQSTFLNRLTESDVQQPNGRRLSTQTLAFAIPAQKGYLLGAILRDISKNKQAEEALRASERRFRDLFEDSPTSLWEQDFSAVKQRLETLRKQGITDFQQYFTLHPEAVVECAALVKVLDVNKATMHLYGAIRKEDLLQGLPGVLEGPAVENFRDEVVKIAAGETRFNWEGFNQTLDGRLINIDLNWSAAPGYEESLARVIVSIIDITERKQAEEALRKSEQVLREAEALGHTGSWEQDLITGEIFNTGENLHLFFGDDLSKGGPFDDYAQAVHPDDREIVLRSHEEMLQGGPGDIEYRVVWPDGSVHVIFARATVVRDELGKAIRIYGTNVDITERKRAEQALRESEAKWRSLFELLPVGVSIVDNQDNVNEFNSSLAKILDISRESLLKGDYRLRKYLRSDNTPMPPEEFPSSRAAREQKTIQDVEIGVVKETGAVTWTNVSAAPLSPGASTVLVTVDTTERKRTEAERQALLETMQAAALTESLPEFLEQLRQSLNRVLYAENLFVVFHDKSTGLFEEVFAVDRYDAPLPPSRLDKSITSYVFRTGEPLLLTEAKFQELMAQGEVELVGAKQASWLGAPLKTPTETIGVIAVQNYEEENCYSERDKAFLATVGAQAALAIERKQAEEELHDSELRFRTLIEEAPVAISVSRDGIGLYANQAFARHGRPAKRGRNSGTADERVFCTAYREESKERSRRRAQGLPVDNEFESMFVRADGTEFPIQAAIARVRLPNGPANIAFVTDISERKRAEEALRARDLDLEEAERVAKIGNWRLDLATDIITWSDELYRIFEISRLDLYNYESFLNFVHPDDKKLVLQAHVQSRESGTPIEVEYRIIAKSGAVKVIHEVGYALKDEQGNVKQLFGVAQEVTERKQAEERLEDQVRRQSALRTIDRAISSSFDLRVTLKVLLDNVVAQLHVDAADVLLLNRNLSELEYAAGVGFRGSGITAYAPEAGRGLRRQGRARTPHFRHSQSRRGRTPAGEGRAIRR